MNLGNHIVARILADGDLQPFLDAGLTLDWLSSEDDHTSAAIFDQADEDAYKFLLNHYAQQQRVPCLELFRRFYPEDTYSLVDAPGPASELLGLALEYVRQAREAEFAITSVRSGRRNEETPEGGTLRGSSTTIADDRHPDAAYYQPTGPQDASMIHARYNNNPAGLPIPMEAASVNAALARQEFAAEEEKSGTRAALETFNARVSHWANQFTDARLRRFVYVLGCRMDGKTHTFKISQKSLVDWLRRNYGAKAVGERQIRRYIKTLEDAGIADVDRSIQDERGDHPGLRGSNTYRLSFHKVLRYGRVEAHDFLQSLQNVLSDDRSDDRSDVLSDDLSTLPATLPSTPLNTPTPTAQQDSAAAAVGDEESSRRISDSCDHDDDDPVDCCLACSHSVTTAIQKWFANEGYPIGRENLLAVVEKFGAGTIHRHLIRDRDEVEHAARFWARVWNVGSPQGYFLATIGEVLEEVAALRAAGFVKKPEPPRPDLLSPGQYARWGVSSWGLTWTGEISETKQAGDGWRNAEDSNDFLARDDPPIEYCHECAHWFFVKLGRSHPCPGWKRLKPKRR